MTTTTSQDALASESDSFLRAIRLFNINELDCAFEIGTIPTQVKIPVEYFFCQAKVDSYEKVLHPAPRRQYVITLKGKLRFTVTNGDTFILEPGIILIAEDTLGPGHSWEILDGTEWERVYVPIPDDQEIHFNLPL